VGGCTDRFCKNVDSKDLSISVASGRINLRNVEVKPSAFDDLRLPITVKSGTVRGRHGGVFALQTRGAIGRSLHAHGGPHVRKHTRWHGALATRRWAQ
jgi:hypothetical protein